MEVNPKSRGWVSRLGAATPWAIAVLLALFTAQIIWTLPTGDGYEGQQDWVQAGRRVDARLGVAESVLVNPAGRVGDAAPLSGLPLICDEGSRRSSIGGSRRDGLWVLGDKPLSRRLQKALDKLARRGTIRFKSVFIHHGWNPEAGKR